MSARASDRMASLLTPIRQHCRTRPPRGRARHQSLTEVGCIHLGDFDLDRRSGKRDSLKPSFTHQCRSDAAAITSSRSQKAVNHEKS